MYHEFEITKREVLFSIVIISVMLLIGFVVHGKISDILMNKYQDYNTAINIADDADMFHYCMRTDAGNAFIHGELKAIDTVTYPEIGGSYSYVKKVKEKYTMHTRTVRVKCGNGYTRRTETYWTWDPVDSWSKHSEKISFLGTEFDYGTISFPPAEHIDTQKESVHVRYVYYGATNKCTGTLYSNLKDNTISDDSKFYVNREIDDVIDDLTSGWQLIVFWFIWILIIAGLVFGFYYLDNRWIEG